MNNYILDVDKFVPGFIFKYKGNKHIVVGEKNTGCYILDIEYDPEFSGDKNPVYFVSWRSLSCDLMGEDNLDLFLKD